MRLRLLSLFLASAAALPVAARAAEIPATVQPLALVGDSVRAACTNPFAPFRPVDLFGRLGDRGGRWILPDPTQPMETELAAGVADAVLQPSVVICSPTYAGLPGPVTGTTAATFNRSRVGNGWRELGSAITSPGALVPGDQITVPEVDDAAELRLSLATATTQPATVATLRDLAPGPVTVAIGGDGRGLTATATRADGTVTEAAVQPLVAPKLRPRFTGQRRKWRVETEQLPGTTLLMVARTGPYDVSSLDRNRTGGTTVASGMRVRVSRRSKRRVRVVFVAINRPAHWIRMNRCVAKLDRLRRPQQLECEELTVSGLLGEVARNYALGTPDRAGTGDVLAALDRLLEGDGDGHAEPQRAAPSAGAWTGGRAAKANAPANLPAASTSSKTATATPANAVRVQATTSPLTFKPFTRSAALIALKANDLRPLSADVNGDGEPDFWTESVGRYRYNAPVAGYLITSGPTGLTPHRVDIPAAPRLYFMDSELSAIADITGDGIGELVVDLGERAAVIPGSTAWTGTTTPIVASDAGSQNPAGIVVVPSLSSPGAPLSTLDDVTGDGLPELVVGDDDGGWVSVPSQSVLRGQPTRIPAGVPGPRSPAVLSYDAMYDPGPPQRAQAFHPIGGQAVSVAWPVRATKAAPKGAVVVSVRDALGRDVRPPLTVSTPGDAVLLDYDRPSGDILLLAYAIACTTGRRNTPACVRTVMRVAPDGRVKHTFAGLQEFGEGGFSYGTARFVPDGPDADDLADVVFSGSPSELLVVESTSVGVLKPALLPRMDVVLPGRNRPWMELRPVAFFRPDGSRRVVLSAPTLQRDKAREDPGDSLERTEPGELRWP